MLEIKLINHQYGQSRTLWDLDISVPEGSCTCLMGRNGVGKTTLLNCVMGLEPIMSGKIMFNDLDLSATSAENRARNRIGYVPQGRQIFSQLTVEENLRIGLGTRSDRKNQIPENIFELFPVLKEMLRRRGGDLSGGQQQQLAIGRALAINPNFLILDEPTEGIQPNIVREIGDIISRLNREPDVADEINEAIGRINKEMGITVLLVEQKLPFARRIADSYSIMDKGRKVAEGKMSDLTEELIKEYLTV